MSLPLSQGLLLAAILFSLGTLGLLIRRNLLFVLISLEVMLNAAGLAFVVAGAHHGQADGQIMFLLVLAVAAAEASVGLAILLQVHRLRHTLDVDDLDELRG